MKELLKPWIFAIGGIVFCFIAVNRMIEVAQFNSYLPGATFSTSQVVGKSTSSGRRGRVGYNLDLVDEATGEVWRDNVDEDTWMRLIAGDSIPAARSTSGRKLLLASVGATPGHIAVDAALLVGACVAAVFGIRKIRERRRLASGL